MKNSMQFAFAILASLSLAACSTSGSDKTVTPTPVTPPPATPAPGTTSTPTQLDTDVVEALTFADSDTSVGAPIATTIEGADGAPTLEGTTYTLDGEAYTLIEPNSSSLNTGDLFAVELVSVDGVRAIGTGEYNVLNDQGSDVDRIDILFSAAPTEVADLPTSTASYVGTYSGVFYDLQDQDTGTDTGIFTATADFGAAQSLTGSFYSADVDANPGEPEGILSADIDGNSFVGVINSDTSDPDNTDQQISAAGYFTGDNASGLVGAAAGTFVHGPNDSQDALIVFEGTAE